MVKGKSVVVIVLNYNDWETTTKLVESIKHYSCIDYIVIVDNNSSDDSFNQLTLLVSEKIHLLRTERNGGYSYGNNCGINYAIDKWNPEITIIANPDVEFSDSFIYDIVKCIGEKSIYAASGITLYPSGKIQMIGGNLNTYSDDLFDCLYITKKIFGRKNKSINQDKSLMEVGMLSGSLFAIDTEKFKEIGLFDESVFLYCEERIIGKKFADRDWKMVVNTNASYIHHHAVSTKKQFDNYVMMKKVFKSRLYYQEKYNQIGIIKKNLLILFMTIGLVERRLYLRLLQVRGIINDK